MTRRTVRRIVKDATGFEVEIHRNSMTLDYRVSISLESGDATESIIVVAASLEKAVSVLVQRAGIAVDLELAAGRVQQMLAQQGIAEDALRTRFRVLQNALRNTEASVSAALDWWSPQDFEPVAPLKKKPAASVGRLPVDYIRRAA